MITGLKTGVTYPVRDGNIVLPLIDSLETYRKIRNSIESATKSVWVVVSFISLNFQFPGEGSFFEVLDSAARRGIDVRVLFWKNPMFFKSSAHFKGTEAELEYLNLNKFNVKIRWDSSGEDESHCHHEKSWLIDCGYDGETVFTGGITVNGSLAPVGHIPPYGQKHDIFCQITGPASTDVYHHFVQRWNEALGHNLPNGSWPSLDIANDLEFPTKLSKAVGNAKVQVIRTIRPNSLFNSHKSPGGYELDISQGEESIFLQYKNAINEAKHFIYLENQHICDEDLMNLLIEALKRGVEILFVVPSQGGIYYLMNYARSRTMRWKLFRFYNKPRYSDVFLDRLPQLASFKNFTLAGLAKSRHGYYDHIYVHSKLAIVDDEWMTIGSANFVDISMKKDHTELNVSVWDKDTIQTLRRRLYSEHTSLEINHFNTIGKKETIEVAEIAKKNQTTMLQGKTYPGLIFSLNAAEYGSITPYMSWREKLTTLVGTMFITFYYLVKPKTNQMIILFLSLLILYYAII